MLIAIILSIILILLVLQIVSFVYIHKNNITLQSMSKTLTYQYNLIVKIQKTLQTKSATNAVTENAEIIYQDLLDKLIPIMASINVMPRNTSEHQLWRALGGIMDEYAKNPFALEKLRRCIKLDPEVARNIDSYIARADSLLHNLTTTDPDGILTATFTDGLLGQSVTFFAQAKQLALQDKE